ncbi:hypothetical protein ACNKHW_24160 [Shigella flexneri]
MHLAKPGKSSWQVLKGRKLRASMGYKVIIGDGDFCQFMSDMALIDLMTALCMSATNSCGKH